MPKLLRAQLLLLLLLLLPEGGAGMCPARYVSVIKYPTRYMSMKKYSTRSPLEVRSNAEPGGKYRNTAR